MSMVKQDGYSIKYVDQKCGGVDDCTPTEKLKVVGKQAIQQMQLPVWDSIGCKGDNIVRVYNKDQCVVQECLIYSSNVDMNIDEPKVGSTKTPPTWDGGYTLCQVYKGALIDPSNICAAIHKFPFNGAAIGG